MKYWHFMSNKDGKPVLRDGREAPPVGVWLKCDGKVKMCSSGFHASKRLIDALQYAQGPWIAEVELGEDAVTDVDKSVSSKRKILCIVKADRLLHEFAVMCAVRALEQANVKTEECWQAVDLKLGWLEGVVSDEDLSAARSAAGNAAWSAAGSAARSAAWSAAEKKLAAMLTELLDRESPKRRARGEA